jgi:hypothetical protein
MKKYRVGSYRYVEVKRRGFLFVQTMTYYGVTKDTFIESPIDTITVIKIAS